MDSSFRVIKLQKIKNSVNRCGGQWRRASFSGDPSVQIAGADNSLADRE